MNRYIAAVPLEKAYRLINHGPTVLVSARHGGVDDVMAAAWACGLDYTPPKLTVVLDKNTRTRELVERSGALVIQTLALRSMPTGMTRTSARQARLFGRFRGWPGVAAEAHSKHQIPRAIRLRMTTKR